jgi:hypothetical protein
VKKPEAGVPVLLIPDELPLLGDPLKFKVTTSDRAAGEPLAICQRQHVRSLAPFKVWHRTFSSGNAGTLDAAQVDAQFGPPQQATAAFRAITGWFTKCEGIEVHRWPALTNAGGRAEFVELTRFVPDDQKTGVGKGVSGDGRLLARERISYAIAATRSPWSRHLGSAS